MLTLKGLVLALVTLSSATESPVPTYHSWVSEVRLTFFATDEQNQSVQDIHPGDFAVVDNEFVIRKFRSFNRANETTLDTVVLIDSSESVLPHYRKEIAEVLHLISQTQWLPEDKLSIASIGGSEIRTICSRDCSSSFMSERIANLPTGGLTPLYDAVADSARRFLEHRDPAVRPVIILFSDGKDTNSNTSFRDVAETILQSEAQVYAIDVNSPKDRSDGTDALQRLAQISGGRYFTIQDGAAEILSAVVDDLHSAHVVTYVPPASTAEFHTVLILPTHNLNLQFRCRRGYYDPGSLGKKRSP